MLYSTALQIQQTDFAEPEANATIEQLEQVLLYFDTHAEHEDSFILPHIQQHNPQLIDELEKDHVIDHQLTQTLFDHIQAWKTAIQVDQKESIGQRVFFAFNEFIAFNLYHMNKEENVLIQLLWEHYTDEQIHQMEGDILKSIPPQVLVAESQWMMRSISNKEVTGWLSGIRQGAPEAVFNSFLKMAEAELPSDRFTRVQTALALA